MYQGYPAPALPTELPPGSTTHIPAISMRSQWIVAVLSRLSTGCDGLDLNQRPEDYESSALPD